LAPKDEVQAAVLGQRVDITTRAAFGASSPLPQPQTPICLGCWWADREVQLLRQDLLPYLPPPGTGCWPDEVSLAGLSKSDHQLDNMGN